MEYIIQIKLFDLPEGSYEDKLRALLQTIRTWEKYSELYRQYVTYNFMKLLGQLFLEYFQFHLASAKEIGNEFIKEIVDSHEYINNYYVFETYFELIHASDWEDVWLLGCWTATNIRAFESMFKDLVSPLRDNVMEYIEERKDIDYLEAHERPENIPLDHWWWFTERILPNWKW